MGRMLWPHNAPQWEILVGFLVPSIAFDTRARRPTVRVVSRACGAAATGSDNHRPPGAASEALHDRAIDRRVTHARAPASGPDPSSLHFIAEGQGMAAIPPHEDVGTIRFAARHSDTAIDPVIVGICDTVRRCTVGAYAGKQTCQRNSHARDRPAQHRFRGAPTKVIGARFLSQDVFGFRDLAFGSDEAGPFGCSRQGARQCCGWQSGRPTANQGRFKLG